MRIAFDVFDFNQDRVICELDTYSVMQMFQDDDEVFVSAFSRDLCTIGKSLDKKRQEMGIADYSSY